MYKEDIASAPGSVGQVREATGVLWYCKTTGITIFIIGHVTKEGMVAGQFWSIWLIRFFILREIIMLLPVLRAVRRFGSTNEIGDLRCSSGLIEVRSF